MGTCLNRFSFKWQCCNADRVRSDGTFQHKDHATNQTMCFDGELTGKYNSCRGMTWSPQEPEWKSNSKHVDDMARLWRLKLESKETPTPVTKATERR